MGAEADGVVPVGDRGEGADSPDLPAGAQGRAAAFDVNLQGIERRIGENPRRGEIGGVAIDLRRRPELRHASLEQGGRVAAEQERFGRFRRGIDEDRARRRENARQFLAQFLAQLVVQIGERLVEQHEIGALHQGARDGGALLLAAGKVQRLAVEIGLELQKLGGFAHPRLDLLRRNPRNAQRRGDVLVDIERGVIDELLVDHGNAAALHRPARHVLALDEHAAARRRIEPGHEAHERGLAGERRAEQHVEGAPLKGQVDVVDMNRCPDLLRDAFENETHRHVPGISAGSEGGEKA